MFLVMRPQPCPGVRPVRPRRWRGKSGHLGWPWGEASDVTATVLLIVVIGVTVWDVIDGFIKASRNRGGSALGGYGVGR